MKKDTLIRLMRHCVFTVLFLLFSATFAYAQNSPLFSNYMFFKPLYNPAAAGGEDKLELAALYRAQWVGINGNPSVQALMAHSPLNVFNSSAGIIATNEMQGQERVTTVMLAYAYRQYFKKSSLSFGVSGGIVQRALDGSKLISPDGNYESGVIDHQDDFIPAGRTSGLTGDVNVGVYLQSRNLYAGVSANNVLQSGVSVQGQTQTARLRNPRYFTALAGYKIKTGKKLYLLPSVFVLSDFVNTQVELNTILQYKDNIYGGVSFRGFGQNLNDAFVLMFGFKIFKNLGLGYSYDFSLSSLNAVNIGSHEIYVRYGIKIADLTSPGKIIYNPRFL